MITYETFKKYWKENGYNDKEIDILWNSQNREKLFKTDNQKSEKVSVGDKLVEKAENATPQAVLHDRLFILQNTEGKFGNIMCINKDTKNPIEYIFNMLTNEIKRTEKFAEKETEQGKMILHQAIQNICNLSIYEIKPELDIKTKEPIFTFNKITEYKGT